MPEEIHIHVHELESEFVKLVEKLIEQNAELLARLAPFDGREEDEPISVPFSQILPLKPQDSGTITSIPNPGIIYITAAPFPVYPPNTTLAPPGWPDFGRKTWC